MTQSSYRFLEGAEKGSGASERAIELPGIRFPHGFLEAVLQNGEFLLRNLTREQTARDFDKDEIFRCLNSRDTICHMEYFKPKRLRVSNRRYVG
ncbi:MAG: hypothetical protein A3C12_00640 [Candidatus Sungbacteria bacterium RIFCSPHIGHO2_02_FULL_49_20]|uniref:Uncharacterized protein n=1 Tax=Candidatus Sungbacteria bacterium RIFCSPHIGHO2_02_FULL_49_20 TaxID=1802272 RepID=A0A1G2KNT1_9BACT|nr:MAG: hypothetical protein A3C12_00640 [Candidatus Sungbacteria bacterium RIFCSPHIGHO2_02_FULL_49_20]